MVFPTAKQIIERYRTQPGTIVEFQARCDLPENVGTDYYVMAKCRQGKAPVPVEVGLAQGLVNLCTTRVLSGLEEEMRSLSMFHAQEDRLLYRECKKYFGDLCLVFLPRDPDAFVRCTCELFCKCAECPHVLALLELKQKTSLLDRPLPLGVGGRAGKAPPRKQPTSALETQEQVNAKADARIAQTSKREQPLSAALSVLPSKTQSKHLAGAPPRKRRRLAALPSFASAEEVKSPEAEAEPGGSLAVPDSSPEPVSENRPLRGGSKPPEPASGTSPVLGGFEQPELPVRGGLKRCLHVAQGFETACAELAAASDREGLEVMFLMFGAEETSQPFCWVDFFGANLLGGFCGRIFGGGFVGRIF